MFQRHRYLRQNHDDLHHEVLHFVLVSDKALATEIAKRFHGYLNKFDHIDEVFILFDEGLRVTKN